MGLREKWGWFFMIISVIIIIMGFGYEVSGCFEDEKQALLQLKSVFKFRENYLPSWSINEDENGDDCYCHGWEGVTCGSSGHLISLSLPPHYDYAFDDTGLKVDFNASILLPFRDLRELYLSRNGILTWTEQTKGSMKLSSSLTKLEILDLSKNYLDSSILQHLSGFHSLRNLSLLGNNIKGYVHWNDFEAMKNLEELDLSGNNITSFINYNETKNLPTRLLPKLEFLDLSWNEELGSNVTVLSIASALPSLKHLKLSSVGLNGQIKVDDFEPMKNLEELDLSNNLITSFLNYNETKNLPTRLLPKLEFLDLSFNYELGSNVTVLSIASALPSLKHLKLSNTGMNGQIKVDDLEAMKNLEELDLSDNYITSFLNYNGLVLPKLKFLDLMKNEELGNNSLSLASALPSLKYLNLGRTGLTGQIELKEIEAFKCLEELDLSVNSIIGFVNYKGCGQMQKLQKLDMSLNALRALPSCWANLSSLQTLDISENQITGNIASSPLIHLHSLESLSIKRNMIQIPDSFSAFQNHTKLKYFLASSNQVIVDNSKQDVHPLAVGHGLQLEVLDLSYCRATTYPSFLHHQHDLIAVDLSNNLMEGNFPKELLEKNHQLEALLLGNNSLIGELQLPSFVHTHLSVLDISSNNLSGYIPPNISRVFPRLSELYMSENGFSGDIPFSLFDTLKSLELSGNRLSGGLWNSTVNYQLRSLVLSFNKFEGELPPFYGFPSLQYLDLQGNNFSGSIKPNMFTASLEMLNLSNNSLEGPIPKDFCRFDGLRILDLSYNMLNGSMQPCLLNLSSIGFLSLNNNKLSGDIDDYRFEYSSHSSLTSIDLSHNDLVGEVPASIGNFTRLGALILKGNQFHGVIPIQLCKLSNLAILDLSNNNLSGPIPSCLSNMAFDGQSIIVETFLLDDAMNNPLYGDLMQPRDGFDAERRLAFTTKSMSYIYKGKILSSMSGLDLSCNRLSGEIPHVIGNLSNLQALNLSNNNLNGSIPTFFSNLKNIESLDLSYNSLNGSIPTQLLELNFIEVFKVAYNNLSGQVPLTAQFATFDASDYEGNPLLCGSPILKSCTPASELPGPIEPNNVEEDEGWMDMEAFYMTFTASSVTMFLAVVVILWINPHWCNVLFYLAKLCVLSTYYFIEDTYRRLRSVRIV